MYKLLDLGEEGDFDPHIFWVGRHVQSALGCSSASWKNCEIVGSFTLSGASGSGALLPPGAKAGIRTQPFWRD
jgi:hypothetical protein